jgi:TetR/AcrR family transcriptional regulator, lmrAB and yxaGH operons repressor
VTDSMSTRERFLLGAARSFRRQGYEATGLKGLVTEAGAPFGSLYHHFPGGKEQLGVDAVRWSGDAFAVGITRTLAESSTAAEAARRMFSAAAEGLESSGFAHGCPIANVAAESANRNEALRQACAEVFGTWRSLIATRLHAEGVTVDHAEDLATLALCTYEGAITLARAWRDARPLRQTGTHIAALLTGAAPGVSAERRLASHETSQLDGER